MRHSRVLQNIELINIKPKQVSGRFYIIFFVMCMIFLSGLFFSSFGIVHAQNTTAESYTLLEPISSGTDKLYNYAVSSSNLSNYITNISSYLYMIVAIIAAFYLVYGGIQYLTTDMSSTKLEGKETIKRVLVGLIFIFSVWTIFNAINPQFLKSNLEFGDIEKESAAGDSGTATSTKPSDPNKPVPIGGTPIYACTEGLEIVQGNYQMCKTVAGNMKAMISAASNAGVTLSIASAYRTSQSCAVTNGTCAKGVSNHQKGLAADFNGFKNGPASDPRYVWLKANAATYGFHNKLVAAGYKDEYNHWSTTGR